MNTYSFIDVDKWAKDNDWKCPHCFFVFDKTDPFRNSYYAHVNGTCHKTVSVDLEIQELKKQVDELWKALKAKKAKTPREPKIRESSQENYKIYQEKALEIVDANPLVDNTYLASLVIEKLQDVKVMRRLSLNRLRYLFGRDKDIEEKRGAYAHLDKEGEES